MTRKNLTTIHPGEFLAETLGEMGLSQAAFARAIGVSPMRISHVVKGTQPVTAELALLFGRAFEQSSRYGLNLQSDHDLKVAGMKIGPRLRAFHSITHA
jgi:addiction module HigA family antidote